MTNIDWMVAQLELYGIDTQMEREQPWELPDALETALEDHLVSQMAQARGMEGCSLNDFNSSMSQRTM